MISHSNQSSIDAVIVSVPFCEPYPLVAPILLSACLNQAGISARGMDLNAQFLYDFKNKSYFSDLKTYFTLGGIAEVALSPEVFFDVIGWVNQYLDDLANLNPKYIGLSIFSTESLDFGLLLSYCIRKRMPHVKIIAGGHGLGVNHVFGKKHYEIWNENGVADAIIVGDGETEIIDTIVKNKTGLIFSPQQTKEDLDAIPSAEWQDYDMSIYKKLSATSGSTNFRMEDQAYMAITGSKGCVRDCSFCDVSEFWPKYIFRDPTKIANEIIHNYRSTGITRFQFTDNLMNGSISGYNTMNRILAETIPNTIRYSGYAIFRGKAQMSEQDFELAARAGCISWGVGVESGSERVRNDMKKKFTNEDITWGATNLRKYNIKQIWLLMVGYPTETEEDFDATVRLLQEHAHLATDGMIEINITPTFMLTPNSPMMKNLQLAEYHGIEHNRGVDTLGKFWTSTKNPTNTYPERSRRWKTLVKTAQDLGYSFGHAMFVDKFTKEIESLDRIYIENQSKIHAEQRKIIPIFVA